MVLVDTSVWVDFLRHGDAGLADLLAGDDVLCHPFVIGEIACGRLSPRKELLDRLALLPKTPSIRHDEALEFIEMHRLAGQGLGFIEVNLLASAVLGRAEFWSRDKRLRNAAVKLGIGFDEA